MVSADTSAPERSPRDTRLRLNKMERWFRTNAERFTPEDQVFLRLAFEYAEKSADADVLADALRDGMHGAAHSTTPAPQHETDHAR